IKPAAREANYQRALAPGRISANFDCQARFSRVRSRQQPGRPPGRRLCGLFLPLFPASGGSEMLTFLGARQKFCDGLNRRNFLRIGAFGAGLTLADMLRLRASAANTSSRGGTPSSSPKAAIMIYLPGGPSHMDMYDLKPNAPKEFRGEF